MNVRRSQSGLVAAQNTTTRGLHNRLLLYEIYFLMWQQDPFTVLTRLKEPIKCVKKQIQQ